MKKSFIIVTVLALALIALVPTASAQTTSQITFVSVTGTWHSPTDNVPGSQPGDPVITNGSPTSSISWGTTSGTPQSGYDFTVALPPPFTLPGPIPYFSLGTFTHRNFAVGDPSLTSVQLDVALVIDVDGVLTGPLNFSYTLNHEETPNNLVPCPYPTPPGEGCTDRVTIVASPLPTTFQVAGVDYTLAMNFLVNGNPVDEYITREGGTTNSSGLVGDFAEPPPPPGTPVLRIEKTGPATLDPAEWGDFVVDAHNAGVADAFNVTLIDRLPDGPTGGMCNATPQVLSARVFAADGVTPVPGKGLLAQGTDYSLVFDGATCELTFSTITAGAVIGVDERLVIAYRAQVDSGTQFASTLTNVAGATEWFNDVDTNPSRIVYARALTDGTVGITDHEDAHTVTVNTPVLRFEKTVANVTTGDSPATVATPGDTLRYSLLVENLSDVTVDDFSIVDDLDVLNGPPAFQPGSLNLVTVPTGAVISSTNPSGGTAGTGLLDVRSLSIGGLGQTVLVEFEVVLQSVIADGTYVFNQSQLMTSAALLAESDDPNVNGQADPVILDDDDPTQILINSAPYFDIDKVSSYITGDPAVLLAGETLRYTITVANIGTDNATDVAFRDNLPASTVYVSGSTTLNGVNVPEATPGVLPLVGGILINAPSDTTAGYMPGDPAASPGNVATIVFDVVVDPALVDGTVIANQGFLSAPNDGLLDLPSDDPRTPVPDDPTRDVVGNLPLLFATKSAALQIDLGTPNVVDPGDTLRYTITVYNNGAIPATEAILTDAVPANTAYVADSTTLNGLAVGRPDNGTSPLASGIPISSSDLAPPGPTGGTLTAGQAATVQFDLLVDAAATPGTLIINQASVASYELADVLTDGDGNPATGPEPTVVLVGPGQQLTIAKQVAVVGGGPALAGATLEYAVYVRNIAAVPASYVVITDDLNFTNPGYLTYVPQSATMNASTDGVTFTDPLITADFATEYGDLAPGEEVVLRFQAVINPNLADGTIVTNTASVTWNDPPQYAEASVSVAVGGVPGIGALNGTAWHDSNFDNILDSAERLLDAWTVNLYRNGALMHTTVTGQDGSYRIVGVAPNYATTDEYELRFVAPGAGPSSALLGLADSAFTDYLQRIGAIIVVSGDNLQDLNLPIDPNGVVYNSMTRTPLMGATLTLIQAGSGVPLPATCFDDIAQQDQVTLADGYYKFDLDFAAPACSSGDYLIQLTSPAGTFVSGYSEIIPPTADASTTPLSVPLCPASPQDAIPATVQFCEAQPSEFAPPTSIAARANGTEYYVHLTLDGTQPPGSAQIFNNHIPIDPELFEAVSISKTTPLINVNRGQLVPYTITVNSEVDFDLQNLTIADRFPAGFRYVQDSARIDGEPAEPVVNGRELTWSDLGLTSSGRHDLQLLLAVGAGISEGEYVNRAQAVHSLTGSVLSGESAATVRLVPDPNFDCTDVMGKVYDDANRNGIQDLDERGIGRVRLVTARGLSTTTDEYGRFHITCAIVPREGRGSNFILKLDDRTLPSGFRGSTSLIRIERATRGKTLRFNFGASIHRVIGLDIADPVFEPGLADLRPQWQPRLNLLLEELQKGPATLRLSYLADVEDPQLVDDRVEALKAQVLSHWDPVQHGYELVVEPEVFWRRGEPPERSSTREAE